MFNGKLKRENQELKEQLGQIDALTYIIKPVRKFQIRMESGAYHEVSGTGFQATDSGLTVYGPASDIRVWSGGKYGGAPSIHVTYSEILRVANGHYSYIEEVK